MVTLKLQFSCRLSSSFKDFGNFFYESCLCQRSRLMMKSHPQETSPMPFSSTEESGARSFPFQRSQRSETWDTFSPVGNDETQHNLCEKTLLLWQNIRYVGTCETCAQQELESQRHQAIFIVFQCFFRWPWLALLLTCDSEEDHGRHC